MQSFIRDTHPEFSHRTAWSWCSLVLSFSLVLVAGEIPSGAQPPPDKGKKATTKAQPKAQPKQPAGELIIDAERLPPGFQPPPVPPAIMEMELPIASKEEIDKLKKEHAKFFKVRSDCDTSDAGRKITQASIRYRLALMAAITPSAMRENPNKLQQLRTDFLKEISIGGMGSPAKRPPQIQATFIMVNDEVLKQIPELLKNNFYMRMTAVVILSEMDYGPAYELLLQVLHAKDIREDENNGQPESIKIVAVKGLTRIVRFTSVTNAGVRERGTIANAIVDELKKKDLTWWCQWRMIEVLRYCNITGVNAGNNNNPFVVECLLSIIKDGTRDWRVRAKACYALGRVPLPGVKPEDVVNTIADFALKLSTEAAANPKNPIWKSCIWDVYLAFHPNHRPKEQDRDAEDKRDGGLLANIKPVAQPAYEVIVPIVNDVVVNGKAPDAGNLKKLNDFVRARG